jgi:ATP-dependent 26S proteasome regulatory subunit
MDDIARWSEPPNEEMVKPAFAKNGRIVVLGATNAPWMIDKAFLRPGRLDRAVHVGLPNVYDSEEILRVHVSRMKLAPHSSADEICKSMAELCLGYSGADLAALCRSAAIRSLSSGNDAVEKKHFIDARMHDAVCSSNETLVKRISSWQP